MTIPTRLVCRTVHVELGSRSYDILIGNGDVPIGSRLPSPPPSKALIVTDSNVGALHRDWCVRQLSASGIAVESVEVPAGESSKSLAMAASLYDSALAKRLDRRSLIVALGGGVVGDLAGFVAATYLRGIRYLQVPTSLLAMVDSSVGGKTGVDLPQGKNLVGAFHQPAEVVVNLDALATLPEREYRSGLAEVVKYGAIWDEDLFARLEDDAEAILSRDTAVLSDVVARCCEIKAEVVSMDETESGVRSVLNFGHTLGHALEAAGAYGGGWLHGEAVAAGMAYAAHVSREAEEFPSADAARLVRLLRRFGLPTHWRRGGVDDVPWAQARELMAADKKSMGSVPRFVLLREIGEAYYGCEVQESALQTVFEAAADEAAEGVDHGGSE